MPSPRLADLTDPDGPTLMTYLGWLRRRWWILLLVALIGAGAGMVVTSLQTRTYVSTTSLLVRQLGTDANPAAKVNLDTEAQVVRSLVVGERARTLMKSGTSAEELVRSLTVTVPPNSQVLQIAYEARTPEGAQSGSHSFAQAYLDLRLATATRAVENETAALKQQIADVNKQLSAVAGRIAAAPANSVERARAEADRSVLTNQLASLNSRLSPLLAPALEPGEIISDAPLPTKPSSPNRTLNLASGMGAGLLFGIVLALILDRLDTRVRRGRDIADRLGLPILLELPARATALTVVPPAHRIARELGRLRNVLLSTVPEPKVRGRGRQLLLCDASAGSAAGFVAANLAAAYARTGQQVALVTTKPASPLATIMGAVEARHNLADVLRRDVTALNALAPVPGLGQLRVLLPGNLDADIELPVAAMLEVLAELSARFDHVLIETARPTVAVEAQALARYVDAVILVAESGRTRSGEIAAALRQFEQVDAPVLGAVLTPRLPVADGSKKAARVGQPDRRPARPTGKAGPVAGQAGGTPPPPATDSTIVLPRMKATGPDNSIPVVGTGKATTYRSGNDVNGTTTPSRISYALDSGEDLG